MSQDSHHIRNGLVVTVVEPPKLYLDTNHLINIANLRKGKDIKQPGSVAAYKQLDDCIRNKHFGLIFNAAAPLEWVDGNATLESAYEIADVVESATLQYEIESDQFVWLHEVLKELKLNAPVLVVPEYEMLFVRKYGATVKRPIPVLLHDVPEFFEEGQISQEAAALEKQIPVAEIRVYVKRAWEFKKKNSCIYQEREDGFKAASEQDIDTLAQRNNRCFTSNDTADWIKRFLRIEIIISKLNPEIEVESLLKQFDVLKCPAVNLFLKAHEKRIQAGKHARIKDNDVDDWFFLPVIPYADVVLADRGFTHFIREADKELGKRVTHDPNEALNLLKPWL